MLNYGNGNTSIAGSSAAAGGALTGAGANAVGGALNTLAGYKPAGGMQSNIDAGNQYAAGQDIPGLVTAAMRDATRTAGEQTLPQIARNAAGTGNINSSRRSIQEGIVQRGLNDQAGDLSAQLRQNAFNTGATLNEQNNEAANNNLLSSIVARLTGGNSAVGTGVGANTGAVGQQGGLFDIANAGIGGQNMADQANLTNQEQQFEAKTDDPFRALQNFYSIIGATNWGGPSTGTSTTTSKPSTFQVIGGLMSGLGGLLHSDVRLKTNIEPVGKLDNGLTVYKYRYLGHDAFHLGLLAQEVEKQNPDAVAWDRNGFKMVDYDKATK
jgi:hypothetical protein